MDDLARRIIDQYPYLTYLVIVVWTFFEGETIVIFCAMAYEKLNITIEVLAQFAFAGTFFGDQLYYYIGRRYGAPLLSRWPRTASKVDWAFHLVKDHPNLFILSFRFIYGIRNIAPFIIGISGVPRLRYFVLNFTAAQVWAHTFAWGGFWLGEALELWLGSKKWYVMLVFFALALVVGVYGYLRQKYKMRHMQPAPPPDAAIPDVAASE